MKVTDVVDWAAEAFGECELGDQRRTRRLVKMAIGIAGDPAGGFPRQFGMWGDVKAAYRLFDAEDVTFEAIASPHWRQTRQAGPGRFLVLGDTTEIDFGIRRSIEGLGPTGNGGGRGCLLHSALVVGAGSPEILGLAGQKVHYRQSAPKGENATKRLERKRESEIWGEVIDSVGPPPEETQWVHVLDRGADNFEVFCHCRQQGSGWVVRAAQMQRHVQTPAGLKLPLREFLPTLPVAGTCELKLRARPGQAARTAKLEVRFGSVLMPEPKQKSPYVRQLQPGPMPMWVVWVRELNPPRGARAIEWVLYASVPVTSFEEAREVVGWYGQRWLIEEWHKALKTGCRVEDRQLKTARRLEAMLGVMSVTAVRLLQLKSIARTGPDRPAGEIIPRLWIEILYRMNRLPGTNREQLTVSQFYRGLARLGGFLGRKGDGDPGWMTLWQGWETLRTLTRGHALGARSTSLTK